MSFISELECSLDLISILEHWFIDTSTLRQASRYEWRSHCFIHMGDGDSALSIKLHNGRYYLSCFSHGCFNGTLVDVGLSIGKTFADIVRDYQMCQGASTVVYKRKSNVDIHDRRLPDNVMDKYERSIHTSYVELGFDRDILLNIFQVRFCNDANEPLYGRVIYPIRDKRGIVRSIQGRRTNVCDADATKYMFEPGYPAKHLLYGQWENMERIHKFPYLIVVESPKSVYRGYQLGIPCVALMGIRWTDAQCKLIAAYGKPTILCADNDQNNAGINGMVKLERELRRYVDVRMVVCPHEGADISDYGTRDEWKEILGV